jgi:iron complex transport system substrate-binding protein
VAQREGLGFALTLPDVRLTLLFQFAGMGSGEGRENRPRSRHCNRLNRRKPGYPPAPHRDCAFREKKRRRQPHRTSHGAFSLLDFVGFVGEANHLANQGRFVQQAFLAGRAWSILKRAACAIAATLLSSALLHAQASVPTPAAPSTTALDELALREVTDETGRTIRIPQTILRIVSLAPSLTETLYALGLQERLVGDTVFCDFPPDAQKKTKVGGAINPSIETIASLHPDLVLVTKNFNRLDTVRALADIGIPSYATGDPHTIYDIVSSTQRLADLLGAHDAGSAIAKDIERRLAEMQQRIASLPQRRVLFVVWHDPLISVGKGTFIADALLHAGAISIVESSQNWPQMSLEAVVREQPEFLIFAETHSEAAPPSIEGLASLPGWRILDAMRNHRIALVSDAVNRPAPRIVDVIEDLARQLHPEAFADKPENRKDKAFPPVGVLLPDLSWLSSSSLLAVSECSSVSEALTCDL